MSNPGHVPAVLHYLTGLAPASVLDVGVGLGTYGFLARQFLDVSATGLDPHDWRTRIDGVEVFANYANPIWDRYYDDVAICDIRDRLAALGSYDVVLCNDVLEHFPRDEARALIAGLLDRCRVLIATTPVAELPQGPWEGNVAETHHCVLAKVDFPASTLIHRTGITNLYVSWSDARSGETVRQLGRSIPRIAYPRQGLSTRVRRRLGHLLKPSPGR